MAKNRPEKWRAVPGYPRYEISSVGRLRNLKTGRILNPKVNPHGYIRTNIFNDEGTINAGIHCLVLEAFRGPRPKGFDACHLDGTRTNNAIENLVWGSRKENYWHSRKHGTAAIGVRHGSAKLSKDDIAYIKANYRRGYGGSHNKGNCLSLAKQFGVNKTTIQRVIKKAALKGSGE
jgi:hypothetical protein